MLLFSPGDKEENLQNLRRGFVNVNGGIATCVALARNALV